ncbi:MAG: hypothetical protein ACRD4J_12905, partial [Nitrososphaeraceae archaeon]
VSSNEANKLDDNLGYITHCFDCGDRRCHPLVFSLSSSPPPLSCCLCGSGNNNYSKKRLSVAGPLWVKPIFSKQLISDILYIDGNNYGAKSDDFLSRAGGGQDHNSDPTLGNHKIGVSNLKGPLLSLLPSSEASAQVPYQKYFRQIFQLLCTADLELDDQPYYYTIDEVGSAMRTSPPSMNSILEQINEGGFRISRTSFRPTGFKTNASMEEIKKLL